MRLPSLGDSARALSLALGLQKTLSSQDLDDSRSRDSEIAGGSPFSFCEVSRSTDLFAITSVELTKQPVYIDDAFIIHLYGTFQNSFAPGATLAARVDCGSHCEEYGNPPGETPGETDTVEFCEISDIEQPLGGKQKERCPPQKGYALISSPGYIMPMLFHTPGWYNFTFDATTAEGERIYCLTAEICLRWEDEDKNKNFPPGRWNDCRWPR